MSKLFIFCIANNNCSGSKPRTPTTMSTSYRIHITIKIFDIFLRIKLFLAIFYWILGMIGIWLLFRFGLWGIRGIGGFVGLGIMDVVRGWCVLVGGGGSWVMGFDLLSVLLVEILVLVFLLRIWVEIIRVILWLFLLVKFSFKFLQDLLWILIINSKLNPLILLFFF